MEIQRAMAERNASIPEERRIEFRIGINVGDIIIDEGDIYGDGVNIAARVETLASQGAICISDNAYQQIKGKLAIEVSDLGEQQLKNIAQPNRLLPVGSGPGRFMHREPGRDEPRPTLSFCHYRGSRAAGAGAYAASYTYTEMTLKHLEKL
jgi:adenylate cyclase